jgi:opacity protein-like surface antigen
VIPMLMPARCFEMAVVLALSVGTVAPAFGQEGRRAYVGLVAGIATLSADAQSVTDPPRADVSLYKPENGPTLNALVGMDLGRYFTVQANYIWNRNDLTLLSSSIAPQGGSFLEQARRSTQQAVIADALLYFRPAGDTVRPYLSTGVGVVRFHGDSPSRTTVSSAAPVDGEITSTRFALRVAVGIDLAFGKDWMFRYSFSETMSGNPVSEHLMPPGMRALANFQNLFGIVRRL